MANRPIYIPIESYPYVKVCNVDFEWFPGFAISQKQKSIASLHNSAMQGGLVTNPLEISSKSEGAIGIALSAFNLSLETQNGTNIKLENLFQSSKIFEKGGPYRDLINVAPIEAKRDTRLKESGDLIGFQSKKDGRIWPTEPKTLFYDWLYLNTLKRNPDLADKIKGYDAFTDIEFNPSKSFNCQARSAALFVALERLEYLEKFLSDETLYIKHLGLQDNAPSTSELVQKKLI